MNAIFGDATTAIGTPIPGTPSLHAESDALIAPGSSAPNFDLRGRPRLGAANAIPGLNINPPDEVGGSGKAASASSSRGRSGGWFSILMGRGRSGSASHGGQYAALDGEERG